MYRWILALAATATLAMPGWGQTQNYFGTTGAVTNLTWSTVIAGPYTSAFATNASGGIANFNNAATVSSGSGIFTWAGANFNAAVTWAAGGTFTNQGNGVIPINVSTGNTINFGSQTFTTSGTAGYIKNGDGTLTLGGGTYGGGFTLNAGTVLVGGVNALGSGGALVIAGGTIGSSAGNRDLTGKYSGIAVNNNFTFGTTGNSGNLTFSNNLNLGSATRTVTINGDGRMIFNGNVLMTGANGLVLTGPGQGGLEFGSISNTSFSGPVTLNGGELRIAADNSIGTGTETITIDGGRFASVSGATFTINAARSIKVGSTAGTAMSVVNSGTVTYNGVISDLTTAGVLVKQGAGTLSLGGVNSYTGDTSVNNGTLRLTTGNNRLPTNTTLSLGQASSPNLGNVDLNGQNQTVAGLVSVTGTSISTTQRNLIQSATPSTLTISGSGNYVFSLGNAANSGNIIGSVQLVMAGSGKQTLGAGTGNTYTGGTTVSAGTLEIGAANSVPSAGGLTINGTGTFSSGAAGGFSNSLGALALNDTPTISLGTGAHTLTFTTLNDLGNSALTINGWTGSFESSGTGGKLIFTGLGGVPLTANLLYAGFLSDVNFTGFGPGIFIANGGNLELVPVPEPATVLVLCGGAFALGGFIRRRRGAVVA